VKVPSTTERGVMARTSPRAARHLTAMHDDAPKRTSSHSVRLCVSSSMTFFRLPQRAHVLESGWRWSCCTATVVGSIARAHPFCFFRRGSAISPSCALTFASCRGHRGSPRSPTFRDSFGGVAARVASSAT
jgi:hypothetical protein